MQAKFAIIISAAYCSFMFVMFTFPINYSEPENGNITIILLPGFMGNQLKYTSKDAGWLHKLFLPAESTLWLNGLKLIFTPNQWAEDAKLFYSPENRTSSSRPGIKVEVPEMGSLKSMRHIAPFPQRVQMTLYFNKIIEALKSKGYKEGFDLYGAPRDWRKTPNELSQHFSDLKQLIESSYAKTGGKKVLLVGHSMGGNIAYIFLRKQSKAWKNKYIRAMITIGTPWGGGFKYIYGYLHDDDYPANLFSIIRQAERTFPSYAFLVPTETIWKDSVLIETPSKNYTVNELREFFDKINNTKAYEMYEGVKDNFTLELKHPEVDVYCLGGLGLPTLRGLKYDGNDFTSKETVIYADGDTFVNKESLEGCRRWSADFSNDPKYNFQYKIFKADHMQLIRNNEPVTYLINLITTLEHS